MKQPARFESARTVDIQVVAYMMRNIIKDESPAARA